MGKSKEKKKSNKQISIIINITIDNRISIGNDSNFGKELRAEGGGQINKNVKTNANQGGQNAIKGSKSANKKSQFANGNGRSGIAGKGNKEKTD